MIILYSSNARKYHTQGTIIRKKRHDERSQLIFYSPSSRGQFSVDIYRACFLRRDVQESRLKLFLGREFPDGEADKCF